MNHRRVQRVLDFVRDAGREPAERRELLRVAERGLHLRHVVEVARDQHHGDEPMVEAVDHVRQDEPLAGAGRPFSSTRSVARLGRSPRSDRAMAVAAASSTASGTDARPASRSRTGSPPDRRPGQRSARIAGLANSSFAVGVEDRHGVLERFATGVEAAAEQRRRRRRAVGRQPGADRVEEVAELAELVASRQVDGHPEFALAQPRRGRCG